MKLPTNSKVFSSRRITRRDLLGDASLLLGGLAVTPCLASASKLAVLPEQDQPRGAILGERLSLQNRRIAAQWHISASTLSLLRVEDRRERQTITGPMPVFALTLQDGQEITSLNMRLIAAPRSETLEGISEAVRGADRVDRHILSAVLEDSQRRIRVIWRAILGQGANYVRQEVTVESIREEVSVTRITLVDLDARGAAVVGDVQGSPAVWGNFFFAIEHPLALSAVKDKRARCFLRRQLPLRSGQKITYSVVLGTSESGQLRRGFLRYVERERAHPYRTFLHYNSWLDLGHFTPYGEKQALEVIKALGTELHAKRNVTLDSFLFDDGWDDHDSLWRFNAEFRRGFTGVQIAAAKYGAAPGVWLSPWGGYDGPKSERLRYGTQQGYEENDAGFVLSGPRYFERFRSVCMNMIRAYGVNQFKFDGTSDASTVYPGSSFDSDFDAMISLIGDLRAAQVDLYINLTTGTYPSPFWLRYADSIWRGGEDTSFAGVGSDRQQWLTYRDATTYQNVVRGGPLFPLNSLMLHGLVYARYAERLNSDPMDDFAAEVRSFFGTGTQLQEMYITHGLLSPRDWNTLAAAAHWSRRNADILVDTHWIGGDPHKLEVYGWSSWSPRGGIVTLRNPSAESRSFDLEIQSAFELPAGAPQRYLAFSPWSTLLRRKIRLHARKPRTLKLAPFEVINLNATPEG